MRAPKNIDKEQEAVFNEVKKYFGLFTILDEGFHDMFARFTKAYKSGLSSDQVIKAMEQV